VEKAFSAVAPDGEARALFEALESDAAGNRNAPAIGDQTMRNMLAIRDKLPAERLRVRHARLFILRILLFTGQRRDLRKRKETNHADDTDFHTHDQPPDGLQPGLRVNRATWLICGRAGQALTDESAPGS
jgi:hypothetical protein